MSRRKKQAQPQVSHPTAAEIEAALEATGVWMYPTGHLQVIDQPRVYLTRWARRYGVNAHEASCVSPTKRDCGCDVLSGQFYNLEDAVAFVVAANERGSVAA